MSKISGTLNITQAIANGFTWPVQITGPSSISFSENITLTGYDRYFDIQSDNVTIDGLNNKIIIKNANAYPGLVKNGSNGVTGKTNITIQNINMSADNSIIADNSSPSGSGAWICQSGYGFGLGSGSNLNVKNVHTDATCNGSSTSGLICGQGSNYVICTYCSSKGTIGPSGGGIFATSCTYCKATDCFSTGTIGGERRWYFW